VFQISREEKYNVSTIHDIIDGDAKLEAMMDNIKTEKSAAYLLLCMIFIGNADTFTLQAVNFGGSTFRQEIIMWHEHQRRKEVLVMTGRC